MREPAEEKKLGLGVTEEVAHSTEEKTWHHGLWLAGCQPRITKIIITYLLTDKYTEMRRLSCSWRRWEEYQSVSVSPAALQRQHLVCAGLVAQVIVIWNRSGGNAIGGKG